MRRSGRQIDGSIQASLRRRLFILRSQRSTFDIKDFVWVQVLQAEQLRLISKMPEMAPEKEAAAAAAIQSPILEVTRWRRRISSPRPEEENCKKHAPWWKKKEKPRRCMNIVRYKNMSRKFFYGEKKLNFYGIWRRSLTSRKEGRKNIYSFSSDKYIIFFRLRRDVLFLRQRDWEAATIRDSI